MATSGGPCDCQQGGTLERVYQGRDTEANRGERGPEGLDLSGKDLSGIDLGREAIQAELEKVRERAPDMLKKWFIRGSA